MSPLASRMVAAAVTSAIVSANQSAAWAAPAPAPAAVLKPSQISQLGAFTEVPLAQAHFRTQVLAEAIAPSGPKAPDGSQKLASDVAVKRSAGLSAVYVKVLSATLGLSTPGAPATDGAPSSDATLNFKNSGGTSQAWATTTADGRPFLQLQTDGQGSAAGTASWTAELTTTAGHENVYVQFRLPTSHVVGAYEQDDPSDWTSRLRAEFLMNGHPLWSTETTRLAQPSDHHNGGCDQHAVGPNKVYAFGAPLGFVDGSNEAQDGAVQQVTMSLGHFPAGQTVTVAFVVRADTVVKSPCCPHKPAAGAELFCSRATSKLEWDGLTGPVRFWIGPPVS